ncbi:YbhN family protein [Pseudonocardia sp. N23]|uniref:lysylphosphatidylglycerol synthase transmembrane domain-containing protein n=1 Tax=Pseudonocardia sp. N23 TaxID=1987376 RepID=UPI000BFDF321|nr:YbhN family protein [Pseudonocardia sp. N23]GAY12942.1 probable integral membrane protein [Pseudonocardia sp. N23]
MVGQDAVGGSVHPGRRRLKQVAIAAVLVLFVVELVLGWSSLSKAFAQLRAPRVEPLVFALLAELGVMGAYARMQRHLLRSAGLTVSVRRHLALAYAAHSLSVTLPGGTAFSTRYNYRQLMRFGATPVVAAWCIALSGILSATALAVVTAVGAFTAGDGVQWRSLVGLGIALVLVVVGLRYVAHGTDRLDRATRAAVAAVNRVRRKPPTQDLERVRDLESQLGAARLTPGHGAAAAVFALLNWGLDALCLWMCIRAVTDLPVNPAQVLLAYCAGMAAGSITIIPGGLGIIDSALVLGLVTAGIAAPTAIAAVVLYRIISFGFVIGAGWIVWLLVRRHVARDGGDP